MRAVQGYPFERWPLLSRREARESTQLAWFFAPASASAALAEARAILGVLPTIGASSGRMADAEELSRLAGEDLALLLATAPGAPPMFLTIGPAIARVVADRALGGTGADLAPGPVPLSQAEAGLVAYVIARSVAVLGRPATAVIEAIPLREAIRSLTGGRAVVWSAEVSVGDARGLISLIAPPAAIPVGPPPPRALPPLLVRAHLDIGSARLPASSLARMQVDDTLVPDALWLDVRRGRLGHARVRIARSARSFEVTLQDGDRWVISTVLSIAAPKPPSHGRSRPVMNDSPTTVPSLSDVEVELAIELARMELPIAEVAALAPGVVLTTGRLVGERVAIRAGERVLAWGELVDVEGEVGVRITEIAPQ